MNRSGVIGIVLIGWLLVALAIGTCRGRVSLSYSREPGVVLALDGGAVSSVSSLAPRSVH